MSKQEHTLFRTGHASTFSDFSFCKAAKTLVIRWDQSRLKASVPNVRFRAILQCPQLAHFLQTSDGRLWPLSMDRLRFTTGSAR